MDFVLVAVIVLLAGTALWLWYLGKPRTVSLFLKSWLGPLPKTEALSWVRSHRGEALGYAVILITMAIGVALFVGSDYAIESQFELGNASTIVSIVFVILASLHWLRRSRNHRGTSKRSADAHYIGKATMPRKVYEGDSHSVSIGVKPTSQMLPTDAQPLDIQDTGNGRSITLQIHRDSSLKQFLEIELLASGLEVDGERRLRQELASTSLHYHWNCYFPNSGNHVLTLVLRLVDPSATIELGTIERRIRVAKLDHLTKRQVWLLATLAGVASGGLTIAKVLHELGVW